MKRHITRGFAVLMITVILVSVFSVFSFGAVSRPDANTGERDEICTTFSGTTALAYYTGSYSYDNLSTLSASALLTQLRKLMTDTHDNESSYANCKEYSPYTDCENGDTSKFTTLYTSYSAMYDQFTNGNGWNREHVWPQNLGGFSTSGAGSDLHHIRPTENKTNNDRGSLKYGEVSGGTESRGNLSGIVGGYKGTYYEPLDNVKGDVARICLYVHVRYGSEYSKCSSITNVFQSVDVLLNWCALDPVDTWEMERNDIIEEVQGNRNVFIDYPELAWKLYGKAIPTNMTTPSGEAKNGTTGGGSTGGSTGGNTDGGNTGSGNTGSGNTGSGNTGSGNTGGSGTVCTHATTKTVDAKDATCVDEGYTGDTRCASCNKLIHSGTAIPATDKHQFDVWIPIIDAEIGKNGTKISNCSVCDFGTVETIPALKEEFNPAPIIISIVVSASVVIVGGGVTTAAILIKKSKKNKG